SIPLQTKKPSALLPSCRRSKSAQNECTNNAGKLGATASTSTNGSTHSSTTSFRRSAQSQSTRSSLPTYLQCSNRSGTRNRRLPVAGANVFTLFSIGLALQVDAFVLAAERAARR